MKKITLMLVTIFFVRASFFSKLVLAQEQTFRYGIQIANVMTNESFDNNSPSDFYAHIIPNFERKSTTEFIRDQDFINTFSLREWGRTWTRSMPEKSYRYGSSVTVRIRDRDKGKRNPLVLEASVFFYPYNENNEDACKFIINRSPEGNRIAPHLPDGSCTRFLDIQDERGRSLMRVRVSIEPLS